MDEQGRLLARLLDVLDSAGVRHALAGGHAVSAHTRPRLTVDVDLIIEGRRRAVVERGLADAGFELRRERDVLQVLASPGSPTTLADLMLSDSHAVWAEALLGAEEGVYQGRRLPIVTRAALVAMKFCSATAVTRPQEDRLVDVADLSRLVKAPSWTEADQVEATRITQLAYAGAGEELRRLIDDLRNNRPVTI